MYVLRGMQVQRLGRRPHVARCPARPSHRARFTCAAVVGCTPLRVSRQSHVHSVHIVPTSGEARRRADALDAAHSDLSGEHAHGTVLRRMAMVSLQRAVEQCRSPMLDALWIVNANQRLQCPIPHPICTTGRWYGVATYGVRRCGKENVGLAHAA